MSETNRFSEEDIPKAVLARITKGVLPEGVLVATETKNALGNAAKMFVLYLTASEGKTRIGAEHVFKAIDELELPFGAKLKECFESFKSEQTDKKAKKSAKTEETPRVSSENANKDEDVDIVEELEEEDEKQDVEEEDIEEEQ